MFFGGVYCTVTNPCASGRGDKWANFFFFFSHAGSKTVSIPLGKCYNETCKRWKCVPALSKPAAWSVVLVQHGSYAYSLITEVSLSFFSSAVGEFGHPALTGGCFSNHSCLSTPLLAGFVRPCCIPSIEETLKHCVYLVHCKWVNQF